MELKDYTVEELKDELKRRRKEGKRICRKPVYNYKIGVLVEYKKIAFFNRNYTVKFLKEGQDENTPFSNAEFVEAMDVSTVCTCNPKIGDLVRVRDRITRTHDRFSPFNAKICEIIKKGYGLQD